MIQRLSFKEYLETKQRLREALENTPRQTTQYTIRKYCKLVVGESKGDKQIVPLKPGQTIVVEWLYEDIDDPTITEIRFEGNTQINEEQTFDTYWSGKKLLSWLSKNTSESPRKPK